MKKLTLILLVLLLCACFAYADTGNKAIVQPIERTQITDRPMPTRDDVTVLYNFDIANPLSGWKSGDLNKPPQFNENELWKLINDTPISYPGTTNYTWFPGDLSVGIYGGYISGRIIYLQSPAIDMTAAANTTLTFKFKMNLEGLDADPPYDGWDGWNVRASTNGTTWATIIPTSPAYNSTNMYCFGYNGEPEPTPGWGGDMTALVNPTLDANGWATATFDLSAYSTATTLYIRWVLGSDPGLDTEDDIAMYGVVVYDINIAGTAYTFTSPTDMQGFTTDFSNEDLSEPVVDQWTVRPFAAASSEPNVLTCGEENNGVWFYAYDMINYIESPWITLPEGGDIFVDFKFSGGLPYVSNAQTDAFSWHIYHNAINDNWRWYGMGAILTAYAPNQTPAVIIRPEDGPLPMDYFTYTHNSTGNGWEGYDGDISVLAGRNVKFRWVLWSDAAADFPNKPVSTIQIDDFTLFYTLTLSPPTNLTANLDALNQVVLNWTNPTVMGAEFENIIVQRKYRSETEFTVVHTTADPTVSTWTDTNPLSGDLSEYRLFAHYDLGNSGDASNVAISFVPTSSQRILVFDNAVSSPTLTTPTITGFFANRVDASLIPTTWDDWYVKYAQIYIKETGSQGSNIRLWREENEQPASSSTSTGTNTGLANAAPGWYYIAIPQNANSRFERGESFYVGINAGQSASPKIGISEVDGGSVAWAATSSAVWAQYPAGNFMIRVILESGNSDKDIVQPERPVLSAKNYPNPFNPETTIEFNMPSRGVATVEVFNIKGQLVNTILNEEVTAGEHRVTWSGFDTKGNNVTSGVYFYRVQTDGESLVNKMLLLK